MAFVVGEGIYPATPLEILGLFFFPAGVCLGMIVSWRRERLGGIITLGSLLVFYGIHLAGTGVFPKGWAWLFFASPGFLFLLSSHLARKPPPRAA